MNPGRFDTISRTFAEMRLSRRQAGAAVMAGALATSGATLSGRAQEASPEATISIPHPDLGPVTETVYLFVQSFKESRIAERSGDGGGDHTITLEGGLGQTIYFSNRPDRIAGAAPTPEFLGSLGFHEENPPNAALVLELEDGTHDFAVVELYNPSFDTATGTTTYDFDVLKQWESDGVTLTEESGDWVDLHAEFGTTHLFIDGCADQMLWCQDSTGRVWGTIEDGIYPFCWYRDIGCFPCTPEDPADTDDVIGYWNGYCNMIGHMGGICEEDDCTMVWPTQALCPANLVTC